MLAFPRRKHSCQFQKVVLTSTQVNKVTAENLRDVSECPFPAETARKLKAKCSVRSNRTVLTVPDLKLWELLEKGSRIAFRVGEVCWVWRMSDGKFIRTSPLLCPGRSSPGCSNAVGSLQASVVGVICLVVHDQFVVHKVEAVWSGLVRVGYHLMD